MHNSTTSEILNTAADLIEERGWAKGGGWPGEELYGGLGVGLCLEGGIMAALGITMESGFGGLPTCSAYVAVAAHLDNPRSLHRWNDKAGRTASEVVEVLRATALIEAAREEQDAAWSTYTGCVSA